MDLIAVVVNGDERMIGCGFGATVFVMGVFKKRWQIENGNSERVRGHSFDQLRNSPAQDICAGGLVMKGYSGVGTCIN
ncbi:MAG: hypothetical protein HXS44_07440 [Theionarchaea archaeon]|nr:hypothetical protein [Theionarchaea archaeon]